MAVNEKPLFAGIPITTVKNVTTAKTSLAEIAAPADAVDLRLLFTAGANGGFVDAIDYQAIGTGTPAASIMNIWVSDALGANARIVQMITVIAGAAITTTAKGVYLSTPFYFMNLAAGQTVWVSFTAIAVNVTYNVTAYAGQFEAQP